jgi:hypothetical protein
MICLVMSPAPVFGADLMEPWERGLSDLELYVAAGSGGDDTGVQGVAGFGLGSGVCFGASYSRNGGDESSGGLFGMYTSRLSRDLEVDLWGEGGVQNTSGEAELRDETDWRVGTEWSLATPRAVPYLRLAHSEKEDGGFHGLFGVMLPASPRLELHLELSSEQAGEGPWPVHFAVGPNLRVSGRVELLPELSVIHDRQTGETDVLVTMGIVLDPRNVRVGE